VKSSSQAEDSVMLPTLTIVLGPFSPFRLQPFSRLVSSGAPILHQAKWMVPGPRLSLGNDWYLPNFNFLKKNVLYFNQIQTIAAK
jgi:hypothetical protein